VLAGRGHRVHWYSSDFSHLFKKARDAAAVAAAAGALGYTATLAGTAPYRGNVSWSRLASHRRLARELDGLWRIGGERYDLVLVSLPPPALGLAAARWARDMEARLVLDVQDLWPQTFARFWPAGLRWINGVVFAGMNHDARKAHRLADAVVGVADEYVEHARSYLPAEAPRAVMPLGVDLAAFDQAVRPLSRFNLNKPASQTWLFASGSLGRYFDIDAVVLLMRELSRRAPEGCLLNIVGSGDAEADLRRRIAEEGLRNVTMLGRVDDELFASLAAASDVAVLPIRPDAHVYLPNRVFQYFAAGLPIVSTIRGSLEHLLAEYQAGLTLDRADGPGLADAAIRLAQRRQALVGDHRARRGAWVRQMDRWSIANRFADFLESAAR
jgi:glycosyltransferase involved in cell wall biosynthesis